MMYKKMLDDFLRCITTYDYKVHIIKTDKNRNYKIINDSVGYLENLLKHYKVIDYIDFKDNFMCIKTMDNKYLHVYYML